MQSIEDIDLAELARFLRENVPATWRRGTLDGRTAIRDAVASHLGCSALIAENVVDTMVARGFLGLEGAVGDSEGPTWNVRPSLP